jgi:hypothetical protein
VIAIDKQYSEQPFNNSLFSDEINMAGKTPEEMQDYLLSGDPDDLSNEYFND